MDSGDGCIICMQSVPLNFTLISGSSGKFHGKCNLSQLKIIIFKFTRRSKVNEYLNEIKCKDT